jgi:hypothetical protein
MIYSFLKTFINKVFSYEIKINSGWLSDFYSGLDKESLIIARKKAPSFHETGRK